MSESNEKSGKQEEGNGQVFEDAHFGEWGGYRCYSGLRLWLLGDGFI